MDVPVWAWTAFGAVVVIMLAVDLLAHRGAHVIGFKEAARWSAVWVGVSLVFALVVGLTLGAGAGVDFTTAWLLEKSLSVDNLFVFALIFGYFKVPRAYQHRVLFFGVVGALVFRGIFLAAGVAVVNQFTAVLFAFAAVLLYSAWKLLKDEDDDLRPGHQRRPAPAAQGDPGARRVRRHQVLRQGGGPARGHAAARGGRRHRGRRPGLRRRQRAGRACGQRRRVHRLLQQRVRDPRPAGAVLPARRPAREVPLPGKGWRSSSPSSA